MVVTFWNLHLIKKQTDLTVRQTDLIFKPVVGIVSAKAIRVRPPETELTYENIAQAKLQFGIKNVGNLPAKNFKLKVIGKLGKITLPHKESFEESNEGVVLVQGATTFNTPTIGKNVIEALVQKKERLFYTFDFSYSDWEEYEYYSYSVIYEVFVKQKEPLDFSTIYPIISI